jgi:hypothetical protein
MRGSGRVAPSGNADGPGGIFDPCPGFFFEAGRRKRNVIDYDHVLSRRQNIRSVEATPKYFHFPPTHFPLQILNR